MKGCIEDSHGRRSIFGGHSTNSSREK